MARSPIHHLEQITVPLALFQGSEDTVVPPDQAEKMYDAMAERGLPVAITIFAGEAADGRGGPVGGRVSGRIAVGARIDAGPRHAQDLGPGRGKGQRPPARLRRAAVDTLVPSCRLAP